VKKIARSKVPQDFLGTKKNNNNYRLRIRLFGKIQVMKINKETDRQAQVLNFQREV
jgi:hypothetical protein